MTGENDNDEPRNDETEIIEDRVEDIDDEENLEDVDDLLDDLREQFPASDEDEEEQIRWEQAVWLCPRCGEPGLQPRGRRHKTAGWQFDEDVEPEDVADEPVVECVDCDTEFDFELIPRGAATGTGTCPECDGQLRQGGGHGGRLVCDDCGREYEIRERSWLEQVDD